MEEHKNSTIQRDKIEYAIGVFEVVRVLLDLEDLEIPLDNIQHIKKIIPIAIKELKESNQP